MSAPLPPRSAFIGAGRLAQALAPAMVDVGWPVVAIASRDPASARALASQMPGCRALPAADAVAAAEWVWLAVPDAQLALVASALPWRFGQRVLHAAGATGLDVLAPALEAGALAAGFHPLQLLAGGRAPLSGCGAGLEAADPEGREALRSLAQALGMRPLMLQPGSRLLYHAGANLAASGLLAVLAEALAVWTEAGVRVDDGLAAMLPLADGALAAARQRGLPGAVAGPVARGDAEVLRAQLAALTGAGLDRAGALYRRLGRVQLELASHGGRLSVSQQAQLAQLLDPGA